MSRTDWVKIISQGSYSKSELIETLNILRHRGDLEDYRIYFRTEENKKLADVELKDWYTDSHLVVTLTDEIHIEENNMGEKKVNLKNIGEIKGSEEAIEKLESELNKLDQYRRLFEIVRMSDRALDYNAVELLVYSDNIENDK